MKKFSEFSPLRLAALFLLFCFLGAGICPRAEAQGSALRAVIERGAELSSHEKITGWENIRSLSVSSGEKGDFVLGLKNDGTVCAAGIDDKGQCQVGDWKNITKISAGNSISLGLCSDGSVKIAGYGERTAPDTSGWSDVQDIAAGSEFVLGIDSQGRRLFSGLDECNIDIWFSADRENKVWPDKEDEIRFWSELKAVRAAGDNIMGMDSEGELRCFGFGPASGLPELGEVSDFELGLLNGGVIYPDGTAFVWGDNSYGQCELGDERNFSRMSLGARHSLFLRSDGTALAIGSNDCGQCQVGDWKNLVDVEAGNSCSLGITADGKVLVAGLIR